MLGISFSKPVSKSYKSTRLYYSETGFALLSRLNLTYYTEQVYTFEILSVILGLFILSYNVGGIAIYPVLVYLELIIEVVQTVLNALQGYIWAVKNINFIHPLRYDLGDLIRTIALFLNKAEDGTFEVKIASSTSKKAPSTTHVITVVSIIDPLATKARR